MWSTKTIWRQVLRAGFSLLLVGVVVALGQVPMGRPTDRAVLRLALRLVGGRAEVCRDRTAEELAALPQHMRQTQVCDQLTPSYRLLVALDGEPVVDEAVDPGGMRGDRPIIIDRQVEVSPGRSHLTIDFEPLSGGESRYFTKALEGLPRYRLERQVELVADRVVLVTLDEGGGELVVFEESSSRTRD
jgi:hypothetical protein